MNKLNDYKKENENYKSIDFTRNHGNVVPLDISLNKGQNISQAFSLLTKAVKQYGYWRKCLNKEAIKEIYLKNLSDKQKYYFNNTLSDLSSSLANVEVSTNNNILRQSLIEFYNGISHLNAAYWNMGDNIINADRAANHFKRGALDSYKAIIKDFCFLAGHEPIESIVRQLSMLREVEYKTIGNDKQRNEDNLCTKYQFFTDQIIGSIKRDK